MTEKDHLKATVLSCKQDFIPMPHSRANIFLHFYTDVLLLFLCVYTYAYKAIKRNSV